MIVEALLSQIEKGRSGRNQGLSMGLPKLESIVDGVTRETNTVVFSNSGSGKTSLILYSYIYKPLCEHLDDNKYDIIYFSLEMSAEILLAKLLSTHIFYTYGLEIGFKEILSRKKDYKLDDAVYEIIQECIPWLHKVEQHIFIYDKNVNADSIYAITMEQLKKYGNFKELSNRIVYTPNDPEHILLAIVDHASLLTPAKNRSLKEEIDTTSKYAVNLRNRTGMSWVFVQQANRDQGNIERFKQNKSAFTLNDTKDSGNPIQDSEVVIAIYNPHRDGLKTYHRYDIDQLTGYFRSIMVLKNRYGESDVEIGVNFHGKINVWSELPKPEEIYDYQKYTGPNYLLEDSIQDEVVEKVEDNTKSNLNFIV